MKKIGIITLHGYFNYGNKFQNYATQEVLKSLGCTSITIKNDVDIKKGKKEKVANRLKRLSLNKIVSLTYTQVKKIRQKIYLTDKERKIISLKNERTENFKAFTKKYINETDYIINEMNVSKDFHKKFDYFIVGSDQVWNPYYINNSSIYFLTFAPKKKRIAYSASFGISVLPDEFIECYKDRLSQFEHISVREDAGDDIVYNLLGINVEVLIDPTLMLDKEEWIELAKKSKHKPSKPYLLMYFLGETPEEVIDYANNLRKEKKIKIVMLENQKEDIKDELRYTTDPAEFIDYINTAEMILTDSFHGTVFSILFEKPFITFDRKSKGGSMSSRIDTLLGKFELEDRKWENIKTTNNIQDINFSNVSQILENERNKALKYLREALNIKDGN